MNSSSIKGPWSSFRIYLLTAGTLGSLVNALFAANWSIALLAVIGCLALYTAVSAFAVSRILKSTAIPALSIADVVAMSALMLTAGRSDDVSVLALYGLVWLTSMATSVMLGTVTAAIASISFAVMLLVYSDISQPAAALVPHVFPLLLFFIFGMAGGSLRLRMDADSQEDVVESRNRAVEQANKTARNLFIEKEERERQLFDKQRKLYALMHISHLMSSTRNSKELLQVLCNKAREEMNCSAAFVMMLEDGDLTLVASAGITEITRRLMDCKVGEGLLGEIVASGNGVRLTEKDPDSRLKAFKRNWEGFRNLLVVPLQTSQHPQPFGVLGVGNLLLGDEFQEEHEDYLKILATGASIALKNIALTEDLEQSYHEIIHALAQAIEAKDPYTHGHIGRVQDYAISLARALKRPESEVRVIAKGAILHDVGKISTPNEILNKPGALTPAERKKMDDHVTSSIHILKDIKSLPAEVFEMVLYHHERYDGKGYPYGLKGDEIPLGAQIISVVDAFDAMTTDRPYRKGFPKEKALELLANSAGSQFSPEVLTAFFSLFNFKPHAAPSHLELTRTPK